MARDGEEGKGKEMHYYTMVHRSPSKQLLIHHLLIYFHNGAGVTAPAMISPLRSQEFQIFPEMSYVPLPNLGSIAYAFLLVASSILGFSLPSILTNSVIHGCSSSGIYTAEKKY